jgi:hypothetical protein
MKLNVALNTRAQRQEEIWAHTTDIGGGVIKLPPVTFKKLSELPRNIYLHFVAFWNIKSCSYFG